MKCGELSSPEIVAMGRGPRKPRREDPRGRDTRTLVDLGGQRDPLGPHLFDLHSEAVGSNSLIEPVQLQDSAIPALTPIQGK